MADRTTRDQQERVRRLAAQLQKLAEVSPTTGEVFEDWIDRLIAGESIEDLKPEMDRLIEIYKRHRRR